MVMDREEYLNGACKADADFEIAISKWHGFAVRAAAAGFPEMLTFLSGVWRLLGDQGGGGGSTELNATYWPLG